MPMDSPPSFSEVVAAIILANMLLGIAVLWVADLRGDRDD